MKRIFFVILIIPAVIFSIYARQPQKGYRGFVEWSNDIRSNETYYGKFKNYYSGVSTSHGYQFNPLIYSGLGIVYEYYSDGQGHILAPFLDVRSDLKFSKFTPFADFRLGYNFTNSSGEEFSVKNGGLYISPTVGYRINWGKRIGVNIGIGLTLKGYKGRFTWENISSEWVYVGVKNGFDTFFSFRLGLDF